MSLCTRFVPPAATRAPAAPNAFSAPRARAGAASSSDQPPHVLATIWLQHLLASQSASRAARGRNTPPRHVCAENARTPRARRPHALLTPPLAYTTLPTPSRCSWPHGPHGPIPPPCPRRPLQAMRRLPHTCCSLDVCSHCTCCWRRCTQVALLVCCWTCRGRCGQRLWCFRRSPLPSTLGQGASTLSGLTMRCWPDVSSSTLAWACSRHGSVALSVPRASAAHSLRFLSCLRLRVAAASDCSTARVS